MSNRTIPVAGLLAICLLGLADQTIPANRAAGSVEPPRITLQNRTTNAQPVEILDWSVARYDEAGLRLPDIDVTFHSWEPSMADCASHGGFWTVDQEGHYIDVCAVGVPSRRRMLLHEFAHAWTHENLTDMERAAFVDERGLESWNGPETDWELRGVEQAAEIVTWGLYMYCDPQHMISDESHHSLTAAFQFLTGVTPVCDVRPA